MAQITGSSTIDWSAISLGQIDFEGDIVLFVNRVSQILEEPITFVHSASSTLIDVTLVSGGRLKIGGSGLDTFSPVITSFN